MNVPQLTVPEGHSDKWLRIQGTVISGTRNICEFWGTSLSPLWTILGIIGGYMMFVPVCSTNNS